MEFVAWFSHKYIMHGLLWRFHKDHHQHKSGFFEKNDIFFLIFAIPSWLCIMFGLLESNYYLLSVGIGVALYGFCYFLVHDVFIHQRFKWLRNTKSKYFMALRKAHKIHHKRMKKEDGECFGMLIVPPKYYKEAYQMLNAKRIKNN
jgi:beta-carotene 3-hydroxylase